MSLRGTWYIWYGTRMLVTRHSRLTAGQGRGKGALVIVSYFAAPGREKFGAAGTANCT